MLDPAVESGSLPARLVCPKCHQPWGRRLITPSSSTRPPVCFCEGCYHLWMTTEWEPQTAERSAPVVGITGSFRGRPSILR
jgi:hypothetical protein